MRRPSSWPSLALATIVLLSPAIVVGADTGRELFERGSTASGTVLSARAGADGSWVLRGAAVACANCHGMAGLGGGESFLRAPDLRWPQWSSPDPRQHEAARARLRSALQQGKGADGRALNTAMPRFDLDDGGFDALADHLTRLTTESRSANKPRLALLRLQDAREGAIERDLADALLACLRQRLADRVELETATVYSAAEAEQQWREWQQRPDVLVALAPPWRGWRPPVSAAGAPSLPALFPLVADPDLTATSPVNWLFGGVEARAVALVQAWLHRRPPEVTALPVWHGPGSPSPADQSLLERVAQVVLRDTGQPLIWRPLESPRLRDGEIGMWLDPQNLPREGWWLMPRGAAARPAPRVRWWIGVPYSGQPPRSLAQRWADATCLTVQAALNEPQANRREGWVRALGRVARLRDGQGWEWHVPARDAHGYGASTAWTVVEIAMDALPTPVIPQVDIGRPIEPER